MSLYKINNVELDIDMDDYEFQKKYEDAFEKLGESEKELQKVGKSSEITKGYCEMMRQLFDDIFGEGTSKKLFGEKYNIRVTNEVYEEFIRICSEQARASRQQMHSLVNKYKPQDRKRKKGR